MTFNSSNKLINDAYKWACETALSYVVENRKKSPCYEASLPNREAYCMRDMSHQALGAHYLGLDAHNKNMILQFCKNISESKDFCTFWEITFDGDPCPCDYKNDSDFWYNLPANFDVMRMCDYLYEITGDKDYLTKPEMKNFHELSVTKYINRWDRDGDGIVDRVDSDHIRGICSYHEGNGTNGCKTAGDTVALQYHGYMTAAKMYGLTGEKEKQSDAYNKAQAVRQFFYEKFLFGDHFANQIDKEDREAGEFTITKSAFPVICGIIDKPEDVKMQLKYILSHGFGLNIEELTYMAAFLFANGYDEEALTVMLDISAPGRYRREYPEVSYSVAGDIVSGYMGISPSFSEKTIRTRFGGGDDLAKIEDVPVFGGTIDLEHNGKSQSSLKNNTPFTVNWEATVNGKTTVLTLFPGDKKAIG